MIRARDNDIEVEVEFERVSAKRQRVSSSSSSSSSSSPSITVEDDSFKISYHMGIELKVQKDLIICAICEDNLSPGYSHLDCNHNLCRACSEKLMTPAGMIQCHLCRQTSVGMKQLPMLTTILNLAPRTLKCGKVVTGWKGRRLTPTASSA